MRKLQSQGVHHITIVGADPSTSIDFWERLLRTPFVFEQPAGCAHAEVLLEALVARSRVSLSGDRSPKDPYR